MIGVILAVGHYPALLRSRALLLRGNGFIVKEEMDCERALEAALHDNIDLVLLCHSLKKSEISFLIAALSEKRRRLPALYVRKDDFRSVPHGCGSVANSPEALLNRIGILLGGMAEGQTNLHN